MSSFDLSYSEHLGELSRRKLLRVAESSDTLRRAVLIHNVMRSTASLPTTPIASEAPASPNDYQYSYPQQSAHSSQAPVESSGADSQDLFLFPSMTSHQPSQDGYVHSQEQDWLDSILDDLEDVSVSVVPVDDDDSLALDDQPSPCLLPHRQPLFSSPSTPPPSPPLPTADDYFPAIPDSPPTSPPELDLDSDEGDFDDSDSDGEFEDEAVTPSNSTDFTPSDRYFLRNLPFRNYPRPDDRLQPLP